MGELAANQSFKRLRGRLRVGRAAAGMALIPLLSFVLMAAINAYTVPDKSAPQARQGLADLSGWEFGTKRTVLLDGEWIFYPLKLYTPDDFRSGRVPPPPEPYATIPNTWYGSGAPDEASRTEFGTYRLTVKLKDEDRGYGLRLPNVNGAHRLYANGRLVGSAGQPADDEKDYVKENKPYTTFVRAENGVLDIVLQNANWNPIGGGFEDVQLGLQSDMLLIERIRFALEFAGVFILLLFAGYHLTIYVLRTKDKAYLYSSLYFLTLLGLMATSGEKLALQLLPETPYWAASKLYDFSGMTNIVMLGIFLYCLDGKLLSRKHLYALLFPIVVYLGAVLAIPYPAYRLADIHWNYAALLVAFFLYRGIRLYVKRDGGSDAANRRW